MAYRLPTRILPSALAIALLAGAAACDTPSGATAARDACDRSGGTYAGDVALQPGEAMRLPADVSLCLALPGTGEYALAYADTRAADASRTAREPALDSFTVTVGDLHTTAAQSRSPAATAPRFTEEWRSVPRRATAAAPDPSTRATPWAVGDTFTVYDPIGRQDRLAEVRRVYDGWMVVASFQDDPGASRWMVDLDARWSGLHDVGLPLLRSTFGDLHPATSRGSGQLFVLVRPTTGSPSGINFGVSDGGDVYSWIVVSPSTSTPAVQFASMVLHETSHAYQRAFLRASLPAGAPVIATSGGARWGIEGGAALMEREFARRLAGISPTANYPWYAPGASDVEQWYALFAQPGDGSLSMGYYVGAGFLADLVARRVAAGEPLDVALAEVEKGAAEGWYGWTSDQEPQRTGLVARMRARLGAGWEPADALLTWTMSHALDDQTPSTTFQNTAFKNVSSVQLTYGWAPAAVLRAGSPALTVHRLYGSEGYVYLLGGGDYRMRASTAGVVWMLARLK
jgi:hypothetical protein